VADAQRMIARDGSEVYLTPEDATRAYRAGLADFAAGDKAVIADETGALHEVPAAVAAEQLGKSFSSGLSSGAALAAQREAAEYGTLGKRVEAFGVGVADPLTLGFGKGLAVDLSSDPAATRAYLAAQERHNSDVMMAGEVAGLALPMLLSGGAAGAVRGAVGAAEGASTLGRGAEILGTMGRVASAPTRALGAVAEGAGAFTRGALGEGVLGRAAGAAVRGAVETAPYSVGEAYSHARITDRELTAEQLVAAAGQGALMGGALGGGLSLAASGAGAVLRGATNAVLKGGEQATGAGSGGLRAAAEKIGISVPTLEKIEADQVVKALAGSNGRKFVREIESWSPDLRKRLTDIVQTDVPKALGRDSLIGATRADIAEGLKRVTKSYGKEYEAVIKGVDEAAEATGRPLLEVRPDLAKVVNAARAEVLTPLLKEIPAWNKSKAREVVAIVRGLDDTVRSAEHGLSFAEANKLSQSLRGSIVTNPARVGGFTLEERAVNNAKIAIRDMIESEFTRAGEAVAGEAGADLAARWAAAKANYKAAVNAKQLAAEGAVAESKNNTVGLGAMLSGGTAANVGAGAGMALAGAPGAVVGGALGGLVGAVGGVAVKRHGNQVAATLARRAIETDAVSAVKSMVYRAADQVDNVSAVAAKLERTTAGKVADFVSSKTPRASQVIGLVQRQRGVSDRNKQREYEERHRALTAFRTAPAPVLARTAAGVPEPLRPGVEATATRGAEYLASKAPTPIGGNPLVPRADPGRVDPAQRDRWLRAARAVDEPMSVLDDLRAGRVTREAVDAVKAVYPRLYGQITGRVMAELAQRDRPLTYAQAAQLSVLLGVPADVSQSPAYIAAVQATAQAMPAPKQASIELKNSARSAMTGSQKLGEDA